MKSRSPDFLKKSVDKSKPARYNDQVIEKHAGMAELADALDLGSSGCIHASSSLVTRTKKEYAGVVKLADTYDSGSYAVTSMQVQVLSPAPKNSEVERLWSFLFI